MSTHRPAKMVGWYDPVQLSRTGVEVFISTIFGKYADQRVIQALSARTGVIFDFSRERPQIISLGDPLYPHKAELPVLLDHERKPVQGENPPLRRDFWFDFVADTGDGWDSTYAVATALSLPHSLQGAETCPGELLIFGGDEVYPTASRMVYEQRLVEPFRAAFVKQQHYPTVFALPGNHDWYDNLVSFSRLFSSREPFAGPPGDDADARLRGCLTPQRRSYFALKLPAGWWLLGTDVQLGSDIDGPQFDFFHAVREHMAEKDRVILCTPEPHWVYAECLKTEASKAAKSALDSLERSLQKKVTVSVFIAGDVHHYCRFASPDGPPERKVHKITSGGGGAFLHPTHGPLMVDTLQDGDLQKQMTFPPAGTSRWIGWLNFLFLLWNPWFGLVTGIAYVIVLWAVMPAIDEFPSTAPLEDRGLEQRSFPSALWFLLFDPDVQPGYLHLRIMYGMIAVAISGAFALFTDLRLKAARLLVGTLHGCTHYLAALFLAWLAARIVFGLFEIDPDAYFDVATSWKTREFWLATLLVFISGWVVGSCIMGIYLFLMLNVFNRHWNEAFSSLAIPDWKNFLRLKIDADGTLTIYPIGIRRVPRTAGARARAARSEIEGPAISVNTELIEGPIVVGPVSPK